MTTASANGMTIAENVEMTLERLISKKCFHVYLEIKMGKFLHPKS